MYVAYAILQCAVLQPEPYYSIYDSDNWAKARWFLLKRLGLASGQSRYFSPGSDYAIFNSTTIAGNPGRPNRWLLGQDSSGGIDLLNRCIGLTVRMFVHQQYSKHLVANVTTAPSVCYTEMCGAVTALRSKVGQQADVCSTILH